MRIGPLIGCTIFLIGLLTAPAWAEETGTYKFGRWLRETAGAIGSGTADIAKGMTSDAPPAPETDRDFYDDLIDMSGAPDFCRGKAIADMQDECLEPIQSFLVEADMDLQAFLAAVEAEMEARR